MQTFVLTVAVPAGLVYAMRALAGEHADQFLFVPVLGVAVMSLLHGVSAGVAATAVSMIALAWWVRDVALVGVFDAVRFAGVGAVSLLVAWATGSLRAAYGRAAAERAAAVAAAEELARAKARAERAVEVRDEVLAVVSHDLKNPLATIAVTANLLERRCARDAPELARHARTIQQRVEEMSRLIGDLLDAAAIEAGRLSIRRRTASLDAIGRDAVERVRPLADAAGVVLQFRAEGALPEVQCDPDRIRQVLANLLGNALSVTPSGGTVAVEVMASPDAATFTVSDTGHGIAPEDLAHLFDRFRRGREAKYAGSGLGLSIVRGIVEAHGGRVWVESAPGQGSRFSFSLPRAAGGERVSAPSAPEEPPTRASR